MVNVIATIVLIAILGGAIYYIVKSKKKGVQCIGCPSAASCSAAKNGGCHHNDK